jgi:DNA-binding response OmpR family regulator
MDKARILYVEDDESLAFITKDHLEIQGYDVHHCKDGEEAQQALSHGNYDLCIFDVMLPKMDGFALCQYVRKTDPHIPIIMLTAKSLKEDKISGLKTGADDYITKPFSIEELILKMEVFLRRNRITDQKSQNESLLGQYIFDYKNLSLSIDGNGKTLTQKEADLLKVLLDNKNNVLKRSDILLKVWGEDDYFLGRSLDVFISRLRKYLSQDPNLAIENIHGVGFRLKTDQD